MAGSRTHAAQSKQEHARRLASRGDLTYLVGYKGKCVCMCVPFIIDIPVRPE